jgi:hypothetical protein
MCSFEIDNINTHIRVLCLNEQRMVEEELLHLTVKSYLLGSSFCQKRATECVFLLGQTNISVKFIFV